MLIYEVIPRYRGKIQLLLPNTKFVMEIVYPSTFGQRSQRRQCPNFRVTTCTSVCAPLPCVLQEIVPFGELPATFEALLAASEVLPAPLAAFPATSEALPVPSEAHQATSETLQAPSEAL